MDSYIRKQILDTSLNYRRLVNIYNKWNFNNTVCYHLSETADSLEKLIGNEKIPDEEEKHNIIKIRKKLLSEGIRTENIYFYSYKHNKFKIMLTAWLKSGCQKSEVMSAVISDVLKKNMRVSADCRMIISTNPNEYVIEETPVFHELHGSAMVSKNKGEVSGDSYTFTEAGEDIFVTAIADGMGTGKNAAKDSCEVMDFIEEFLEAGFDYTKIPYIINDALIEIGADKPVTVDISTINLNTGMLGMVKSGGASTFIKSGKDVEIFCPSSLPLGIIQEIEPYVLDKQLKDGDYVIMISDGVADSLPFYDKEKQLANIIKDIPESNPEKMAKKILDECSYYNGGVNSDDMTVLVTGIWEIKNLQSTR